MNVSAVSTASGGVCVGVRDAVTWLSPTEARELARTLVRAAEEAENA